MWRSAVLVLAAVLGFAAPDSAADSSSYSLDDRARTVARRGPLRCPDALVRYRGTELRYHKPVRVNPAFVPRLERMERIIREVSIAHFGRPPIRLVHIGAYNCRRTRGYPELLSEHALGNALDVEALRFGPAPRHLRAGLPRAARRAFTVSVERDWGKGDRGAFLRELTDRLRDDDVFRVMLGPAFPGHSDHFHFDMAPYRLIAL